MKNDWLSESVQVAPTRPQQHPGGPHWETLGRVLPWVLLVGVVAWFATRGQHGGEPVGVEGLRVLMLEESADRDRLDPEQIAIFGAVPIREAVAAAGGEIMVLDVDDDTGRLKPEWGRLRDRVRSRPPVVVFANPKRAKEMPLPADVPEFLKELEAFGR